MKKRRRKDPYAAREAARYARPIPSREFLLEFLSDYEAPLTENRLARALDIDDEEGLEGLRRRLSAMVRDGQLVRNRRDGLLLVNSRELVSGRVLGHPDGYGFLRPDEGGDDLFLSPREMRVLLHGDRIVATVKSVDRRGRREGSLVEVLERNTTQVVGRFHREHGLGFVRSDNKRIHLNVVVPPENQGAAEEGQIVVVDVLEQPSARSQPIGRVACVLGDHMAPGMEIDVAIRSNGIPDEWPEAVLEEIRVFGEEVPEDAKAGRVDLRKLPLLTIDGEDARDFDDAVYCRRTPKGWRLVVAIADVSAYVRPGSALDAEAQRRGNSVYFPGRVVPMLPEILSNGLCSLNPNVDRLCMACEMYLNAEGQVIRSRFVEGVMRSRARLTYTQVARVIADTDGDDPQPSGAAEAHASLLRDLHELFRLLLISRTARGAIDLDTVETSIVFGEGKKIERIEPVRRNDAHRLIEECMLAANVTAARHLQRKRLPFLYRVHKRPLQDKVQDLRTFLGELALSLGGGDEPHPRDYGALLDTARDRPDFNLIQTVVLRSLTQAVYIPEVEGHFGLAYDAYTHFTSPIRRYPDLLVHRALRHAARGGRTDTLVHSQPDLITLGEHCSMTERRADEATRDVEAWLKCEYVMDRIGEEFDGIVSTVTAFGLFVELENIYVEGLVHITNLPRDYYHFDPVGHRLVGDKGGLSYRLGDRVRVRVAAVNLDERKLDFELVESRARSGRSGRRGAARKPRR